MKTLFRLTSSTEELLQIVLGNDLVALNQLFATAIQVVLVPIIFTKLEQILRDSYTDISENFTSRLVRCKSESVFQLHQTIEEGITESQAQLTDVRVSTMCENLITYYKDQLDIPDLLLTMQDVQGEDFDEPFYICDLSEIVNKFLMWKRVLPRVAPYYAVKCNSYPPLLEILSKLGSGFDCASSNEIAKMQSYGIHPSRIIFANPTKKNSDIVYAKEHGVKRMTFSNESELLKVKKYYPEAELVLRIRCDAKKAWVKGLGTKGGCDPDTEANSLVLLASQLNLKIIGVSFHVGSGCSDYGVFFKAIAAARKIFDFAINAGMPMTLLDLGGGFIHHVHVFSQIARDINHALTTYFPSNEVTVIAEPGRFFAASGFTLVTKVINVKQAQKHGKPHFAYTINSSIHGGFGFMLYGAQMATPELIREADDNQYTCTLWGHTCDPNDKLYENILMPKLHVDDILFFRDFGAYTLSLASEFNGFKLPEIRNYIHVKHENIEPLTEWRRETPV